MIILFFFNDTATTEIYTLSLHDALPICSIRSTPMSPCLDFARVYMPLFGKAGPDRKSTRLNSSHSQISYAVFCLKKKKRITIIFIETEGRTPFINFVNDNPDASQYIHLN